MGEDRVDEVLSTIPPHPVRFPFALGLLTVLVLCSVVLAVTGAAMFALDTNPLLVRLLAIFAGAGLTGWFGWLLSRGAGRRTPVITGSTPMHVTSVAAFGLPMGFSLFQLLTIDQSPVTIAMFTSATVGLAAGLVAFVRDADLLDVPIELVVLPSAVEPVDPPSLTDQARAAAVHRFSDVEGESADLELAPGFDAAPDQIATPELATPIVHTEPTPAPQSDTEPAPVARRRALAVDEDEEPTTTPPRRAARRAAPED